MIEAIKQFDVDLFFVLNGAHTPFFDEVMYWISYKFFWIPLYVFFLFLIYRKYKVKGVLWSMLWIAVLILMTDQTTNLFKNVLVCRYRPCHNLEYGHLVHLVGDHCGGKHGFFSGHSSNSFAIAMFVAQLLRGRKTMFFILLWAAIVAYSRVYNGVHYPSDIVAGAMAGMLFGYLCSKLYLISGKKLNLVKAEP